MNEESKEIIETMKLMFNTLSSEIKDLKEDTSNRLTKLELTVENSTNKNIQLLSEGFGHLTDKIDKLDVLPEELEEVKAEIDIIKKAVITHSTQINNLTKIK